MAEGAAIPIGKVDPLNNNNYYVWSLKVRSILKARKLYREVIEAPEPPVANTVDTPEYKARQLWESKNDEAFGIIINTLSDEQACQFLTEENAGRLWRKLKEIHEGNVEDKRIDIGLELRNIKMGHNESVNEYLGRIRNIQARSATLGQAIPQREITYHAVRGIHQKYDKIAAALRAQRGITLEEIQQALVEEENLMGTSTGEGHTIQVDPLRNERAYRAVRGTQRRGNNSGCFICGRTNHIARDCYHRQRPNVDMPRGGTSRGGTFRGNRGTRNRGFRHSNQERREHGNLATQETRPEYTFHTFVTGDQDADTVGHEEWKNIWTLDSGASSHMSPHVEWMDDVIEYRAPVKIAEKSRQVMSKAKGNLTIEVTSREGTKTVRVEGVLYVPELRTSLLSVSCLDKNGFIITFKEGGAQIIGKRNEMVAEAIGIEGIYILEARIVPRNSLFMVQEMRQGINKKKDTINGERVSENREQDEVQDKKMLWHRRLGHICEGYLDTMKEKGVVRDLDFAAGNLDFCEPCTLGKLTQKPHPNLGGLGANEPLEIIHMDLCGPIPVESIGGSRYIYVLVDGYSRYTSVYIIKTKGEAFRYFREFIERAQNQTGKQIKRVRSDNGREFVNAQFQELFRQRGIQHERTVPYNPQSNGVAERTNRTLLEKARAMLIDANLPGEFWAEAVMTAAFLKNITPTKQDLSTTPTEKWSGKKPTVSFLKVFGSIAYYHIPKQIRGKLEGAARKGIFVGYAVENRAYRIYDPVDKRVHIARTVKFNEKVKGSTILDNPGYKEELRNIEDDDFWVITSPRGEEPKICDEREREEETPRATIDDKTEQQLEPSVSENAGKSRKTRDELEIEHRMKLLEREERLRESGVRRSERTKRNKQEYASTAETHDTKIPNNFTEAIESEHKDDWLRAMDEELENMNKHQVWDLMQRERTMKVIKSKWVFSIKEDSQGRPIRYKARLVAVGCQQRADEKIESFAPVIKLESARAMLAIASMYRLRVKLYDVKSAYLYGSLTEVVYMQPPPGYADDGKVCRLRKSIYGLPQSGNCWHQKLSKTLKSIGLTQLEEDPCVYKLVDNNDIIILGVYVDDFLVVAKTEKLIEKLMSRIRAYFEVTETKDKMFLNIKIEESEEEITLSQERYIFKILYKYDMLECNIVKTPLDVQTNLNECNDSQKADSITFQEMLGSLMYLAVGTRPDIAFSVSYLSQYAKDPRQIHLSALKRIYRYLKGTAHLKLRYDRKPGEITISTDASWNSTSDAKAYSGYLVKLGNNIISWKSKKQNLVTLSTCEAELLAICEGVQEIKWVYGLISNLLGTDYVSLPLPLKTDSKSAIDWINKDKVTNRTKHINRKYYFVKDEASKNFIKLSHTRSEQMEADFLTKALSGERINNCIKTLS